MICVHILDHDSGKCMAVSKNEKIEVKFLENEKIGWYFIFIKSYYKNEILK